MKWQLVLLGSFLLATSAYGWRLFATDNCETPAAYRCFQWIESSLEVESSVKTICQGEFVANVKFYNEESQDKITIVKLIRGNVYDKSINVDIWGKRKNELFYPSDAIFCLVTSQSAYDEKKLVVDERAIIARGACDLSHCNQDYEEEEKKTEDVDEWHSAPTVSYSAPAQSNEVPAVSYSVPPVQHEYEAPPQSYSVPAQYYSAPAQSDPHQSSTEQPTPKPSHFVPPQSRSNWVKPVQSSSLSVSSNLSLFLLILEIVIGIVYVFYF